MSELGNAQLGFNNALSLYKDNNLNEAVEQLIEILKVDSFHKEALNLIIHKLWLLVKSGLKWTKFELKSCPS